MTDNVNPFVNLTYVRTIQLITMNLTQLFRIGVALILFSFVNANLVAQTPAFPGAEGFGKFTTGGRGGKVYHVTKLTDENEEGTLRYAVNQKGARTIVFDVSGIIELKSQLSIKNGDLTIAGQTAPGDGICIKNYTVYVGANNVILRFLRFRLGTDSPDGYNDDGTPYQDRDAIWGRNQSDIIIDHCSMSWCTDECGSFYNNKNFTMQWCLLAESLRGSIHPKGHHGYGGIWGGQGASFHHNFLAHHSSRNPRMCGSRYTNEPDKELVDLRNNVFYNWGFNSGYAAEGGSYNFVNNYYKSGPATESKVKYRIFQPNADDGSNDQPKGVFGRFYVDGNYMHEKGANWDWNGIDVNNGNNSAMTLSAIRSYSPFSSESVITHTAETAFEKVLKLAGASLHRDAVDERVAQEAKNGTYTYTGSVLGGKGIIDKTSDVGGWPTYNSTNSPADSDRDGMPDFWEETYGLNPNDGSDGAQLANDGSGYSNLEIYMNSLVCEIMAEGMEDGLTLSGYRCDEIVTPPQKPEWAVEKRKFDFIVGVDGDFKAAIAAAKASANERFYIFFPNGNYDIGTLTGNDNQLTTYSRAKTSFIGQSMDKVVIYNQAINEGISISATLYLDKNADEIYMQDVTLQNRAWNNPNASANRFVALQDRGDKNIFKRVKLLSTQDTYYSTSGLAKSYWEEGEIHGTVDFICGGGDILFKRCLIYLEERNNNVIAAPANEGEWGYVFLDCTIDGHSINANGYRLGRSWNKKASTVFINTRMNLLPTPAGWGDPMNVVPTRFAEYNSMDAYGRAVDLSQRRTYYTKNEISVNLNPVLSQAEAATFSEENVLGGWMPSNDCKLVSAPKVRVNGSTLSWVNNDSALCYFIFKNDVYLTNITECSFTLPSDVTENDFFTVRAANAMGGLGSASNSVSVSGVTEPVYYDFLFHYNNGVVSSPAGNEFNSRWDCTESGAEDYAWAITGREDKSVLSGMDVVYEGATYKTFKNSKGAQSTFYLPDGVSVRKVHFIGYSNGETPAVLMDVNGKTLEMPFSATIATSDFQNNPSVISYGFEEPVCNSFTFTFSTTQVCFIMALEVEENECETTSLNETFQEEISPIEDSVYDVWGRKVSRQVPNQLYIQNGMRFILVED